MELDNLSANLGIKFNNPQLLKEALTHRSYLNEFKNRNLASNERLEFLGDTILSFVVSTWLFKKFPQYFEGKLTNLRSNLVKTSSLTKIAQKLKLGDYLLLSKGERESKGQENPTLLANALEAIIGAVFLDQGIKTAKDFIKTHFEPLLKEILETGKLKDYKSLLQEKIQAQTSQSPIYKTIKTEGPEHNKTFTVNVIIEGQVFATGAGKSKQKAEQQAAKQALEKLGSKK
jgi:ribonuclease-3